MTGAVDTSADYIACVLAAAVFADNVSGIPQMCDLIRALTIERDALAAEVARLRSEMERLRGPVRDKADIRRGLLAAGISAKTAEDLLRSPAMGHYRDSDASLVAAAAEDTP